MQALILHICHVENKNKTKLFSSGYDIKCILFYVHSLMNNRERGKKSSTSSFALGDIIYSKTTPAPNKKMNKVHVCNRKYRKRTVIDILQSLCMFLETKIV